MRIGTSRGLRPVGALAAASLGVVACGGGAEGRQRIAPGDSGRGREPRHAADRTVGRHIRERESRHHGHVRHAAGGSGAHGDLPPRHTILIVAEVHS